MLAPIVFHFTNLSRSKNGVENNKKLVIIPSRIIEKEEVVNAK